MRSRLCGGLILFLGLTSPEICWAQERVLTEHAIAAIKVGESASGVARFGVITLGLVAPQSTPAVKNLDFCASHALAEAGLHLREELAKQPTFDAIVPDLVRANPDVTVPMLTAEADRRAGAIKAAVAKGTEVLRQQFVQCLGTPAKPIAPTLALGLTMRFCPSDNNPVCSWTSTDMRRLKNQMENEVFERLFSWSNKTEPLTSGQWLRTGELDALSKYPKLPEPQNWVTPTPEVLREEFERHVAKGRTVNDAVLSYATPAMVGLKRDTVLRVIDELRDPFTALMLVPAGSDPLKIVSDELGRTRLKDCAQLRGEFSVDNISQCAGLKVDQTQLFDCLNGKHCLPELGEVASAALLKITLPSDLSKLADLTQLPRVGNIEYPKWIEAARACAAASGNEQAKSECLLRQTMAAKDYQAVECVRGVAAGPSQSVALKCLEQAVAGTPAAALVGCVSQDSAQPMQAALCAAKTQVSPEVGRAVECLEKGGSSEETMLCVSSIALGEREAAVLACAKDNASDYRAAALCAATPSLPKDVQTLIKCAQSSSSWQSMAGCAASDKLAATGEVGRLVSCGLTSGGSVVGTAACAAGSGLNPTQAIILQCAATATTGPGFLICTGGYLAFNEFMQCKDTEIGKDGCFGENNEIRKFVRALGLPDIGPNSVVGQLMNEELKVIKAQVAFAVGSIKLVGAVAEAVGKAVENLVSNLGHGLEDGFRAGRDLVGGLAGAVGDALGIKW